MRMQALVNRIIEIEDRLVVVNATLKSKTITHIIERVRDLASDVEDLKGTRLL